MAYEAVPAELRQRVQWVCWNYETKPGADKPTKVPYNAITGYRASATDPNTWCEFDRAVYMKNGSRYAGVGYVLHHADPYTCIDLDDVHGDAKALEHQIKIYQAFPSYAERSPSTKGLHIWVRGNVPSGRRRNHVEVYSDARFMTVTGDVVNTSPITDQSALLQTLWQELGPIVEPLPALIIDRPQKYSDDQILSFASKADNGKKFFELWQGDWQHSYPSQSEADLAFIDILAFYSQNKEQIARLFHESALGKRDKAHRPKYLDDMIIKSFDRVVPEIDFSHLNLNEHAHILPEGKKEEYVNRYMPPAGLLGDIANFIYQAAPYPIPEVALAGAIGLMAGICGRAYNVMGLGLNQYVIMLAMTGSGKEAMQKGINKIMAAVFAKCPAATTFIGPATIQSSEALLKYLDDASPCFLSLMGEIGLQLKQMSGPHAPPHLVGLRKEMLNLYNKSGYGDHVQPMIYSDSRKNTAIVKSPAFSWLGDSTASRFYEALNEDMATEGLIPRLVIIEYKGGDPKLNEYHEHAQPSEQLTETLSRLCAYNLKLNQANSVIKVGQTPEAKEILSAYGRDTRAHMNSARRELYRELWSRNHAQALKLAALIAVGNSADAAFEPIIDAAAATWAIRLISDGAANLLKHFEDGDVGQGVNFDAKQLVYLREAITAYLVRPVGELVNYGVYPVMKKHNIIPYVYLSRTLIAQGPYKNARNGATNALKSALQALIDCGELIELPATQSKAIANFTGRCFWPTEPGLYLRKT